MGIWVRQVNTKLVKCEITWMLFWCLFMTLWKTKEIGQTVSNNPVRSSSADPKITPSKKYLFPVIQWIINWYKSMYKGTTYCIDYIYCLPAMCNCWATLIYNDELRDPWHLHLLPTVGMLSWHFLFQQLKSVTAGIWTPTLYHCITVKVAYGHNGFSFISKHH